MEFVGSDYRKFVDNEYKDYMVYTLLARIEKNGDRKELLEKLAQIEKTHFDFWGSRSPDYRPSVSRVYLFLVAVLRMLFGVVFVVKMLENHERQTLQNYVAIAEKLEEDDPERLKIEKIIKEESQIETSLVSSIDEAIVKYVGFLMLGLADAIIEVTGVQAGFLGVTNSAPVAGLAGLLVGVAASISMGAAAYLQARQSSSENASIPGILTGAVYFVTVCFIASPFFIIPNLIIAFIASITVSALLVAFFSFFISVVQERSFRKEFLINILILASVILITYSVGRVLGEYFSIPQLIT
ncbi:MAG: VIT1/CCC1 family protein [Candidatus Caldarchaeum sp.]